MAAGLLMILLGAVLLARLFKGDLAETVAERAL